MLRVLALVVSTLVGGCAAPTRARLVADIERLSAVRVIPVTFEPDLSYRGLFGERIAALGVTVRECRGGSPLLVRLSAWLERDFTMARNVCAHELGHVMGVDHGYDRSAWMFPTAYEGLPLISAPTRDELAAADRCHERYVLAPDSSVPLGMLGTLEWAASAWNRALGREALTVRRRWP